ncbi:MAG: tetratricopeptide repeat protein [Microcoleaceae cyanobacterium]
MTNGLHQQVQLHLQHKNYAASLDAYQKALELQPDHGPTYIDLGRLYAQQQQWQDAISSYQVALRLCPTNAEIYWLIAETFRRTEQWLEAKTAYQKAIEFYSNQSDLSLESVYVGLGIVLAHQGEGEAAVDAYEHALRLNPQSEVSYQKLGDVWFK